LSEAKSLKSPDSKEAEIGGIETTTAIEETRDSIQIAIQIANLKEKVMAFDLNKATIAEIDALFEDLENDEVAKKLRYNMRAMRALRVSLNDKELIEKLYGFQAEGRVSIRMTPVSFSVYFFDLKDWQKFAGKRHWSLKARAYSSYAQVTMPNEEQADICVDSFRVCGTPLERLGKHEAQHSMNKVSGARRRTYFGLDSDLETEEKIKAMVDDVVKFNLGKLKDEISAFITDGTSKQRLLNWTFRFAPHIGIYDFHSMPKDFWEFWKKEGNLSNEDIKKAKVEIKKQINIKEIVSRSYDAVELIRAKGYDKQWAIHYLCTEEHFLEDWLKIANKMPPKAT
jgi:hypothetical protein